MIRKSDYFTTLCNISRAFGTTKNKDILLDMVVQGAIDTMGGKAACLFLEDEKKSIFTPVAQKGLSDRYVHSDSMHSKQEVEGILDGGFLVFHDVATDLRLENRELKAQEGIASILVVPVIVRDKAIGVLALYTSEKRNFDKDEVTFLSAMAEQGGMAIQNARLIERIRNNSKLFHELASSLNSCIDINEILNIMSVDLPRALGMIGATVRIVNTKNNALDLAANYGLSDSFVKQCPLYIDEIEEKALFGETVVINNVLNDYRVKNADAVSKEGIASMLCIPVRAHKNVIGVMKLFFSVEREFPEDILMLINAVAHQGGIAIQNMFMQVMLESQAGIDMKGIRIDPSLFQ